MNDKLFERVSFFNKLMSFFNGYCDLTQFAMTTGSMRTAQDYDNLIDTLKSASSYSAELIETIPEQESKSFKEDMEEFLSLIGKRLDNIAERHTHLKGKAFGGERYSFFDDGVYRKADRDYEKKISKLGIKINYYKDETSRMMSL